MFTSRRKYVFINCCQSSSVHSLLYHCVLIYVLYRLELHVCVVHMHAHDSLLREKEASAILTILSPWLSDKSARNRRLSQRKGNYSDRIIVMGDLNTLSPFDSK